MSASDGRIRINRGKTMNFTKSCLGARAMRLAALLQTASVLALAAATNAQAGEVVAQAEEIPETVLITGSLIRGTIAVGVPVVNLGPQDFAQTGAISTADLFRSIPEFNVNVGGGVGTVAAGRAEGGTRVNLRQLDTGTAPRNLMMIDGMRHPPQDQGLVVQNIMDRHSSYEYRISTGGGGNPCACDVLQTLYGRVVSLRLQKTW
jgi:TonB-dependent receptor-like protein